MKTFLNTLSKALICVAILYLAISLILGITVFTDFSSRQFLGSLGLIAFATLIASGFMYMLTVELEES